MNAVIITNSDMYEERAELIRSHLSDSHSVTVISTDFLHIKKCKRETGREGFVHLPTRPYRKNISAGRMLSHYCFAKSAFAELERYSPELIWVMLPANSNAHFAVRYKRAHPEVKLVFDIIDMWPESFPLKKLSKLPPFTLWRNMRDRSLKYADAVVAECDLYREMLADKLSTLPSFTLYLAKEAEGVKASPVLPERGISLCYLGSVNNIIDIPLIASLVAELARRTEVTVRIVGSGERMGEFAEAIRSAGGQAILHGAVYDPTEKQRIFDMCHFGINVMRDSVCVGLTMKSMDYLKGGLPLVNNIKCDTARFVESYGAGVNITAEGLSSQAERMLSLTREELLEMRSAATRAFHDNLTVEKFNGRLSEIREKLGV